MTYYNILYGLLFIGAFREVIHSLGTANIWAALLILTMVVNDMINVTDQFEQKGQSPMYSVWMKLVDLICFMAIALALICLDPEESFLKMQVVKKIPWHDRPWLPWALLALYWCLAVFWNALSKEYDFKGAKDRKDRTVQVWSLLFIVPFVLNAVLVALWGPGPFTHKYIAILTLLALLAYMAYFKPMWWKTGKPQQPAAQPREHQDSHAPTPACEAPGLAVQVAALEERITDLRTAMHARDTGKGDAADGS